MISHQQTQKSSRTPHAPSEMATYSPPPAKKPTWCPSKKDFLTLLFFLFLFGCVVTIRFNRSVSPPIPPSRTEKVGGFVLNELDVTDIFGKPGAKAKIFYACPAAGCGPTPIDRLFTTQSLSSWNSFMNENLNMKLFPVVDPKEGQENVKRVFWIEHSRQEATKLIRDDHDLEQETFLEQVKKVGFVKAYRPEMGRCYLLVTDSSVQFDQEPDDAQK